MLCPVCQRPFVATPSPAPGSANAEAEMPVTERVRSKQWSTASILLTVLLGVAVLVAAVPIVLCLGVTSRARQAQAKEDAKQAEFEKTVIAAFTQTGYTRVRLRGAPAQHDLGWIANATGHDKWGQRHALQMIFRYEDNTLEIYMVQEGERLITTSQVYESWANVE